MAVVKNMIVRVGADLSGLTSGFKKGAGATGSFAKQTRNALRESTLSLSNLKKAMASGNKNTAIVSLTDQIRELEAQQKAAKDAGFSWGYEVFENNETLLRDLKSQLNDYIKSLNETGSATEAVSKKNEDLKSSSGSVWKGLKKIASHILGFGKSAKSSSHGVEGLIRSIRRIGFVSVGLSLVKSLFGEMQSIVSQYVSQNEALQAQVTTLKNSLGQALAPAINIVTNALSAMMPYIVGVSNAIGSLISNLFGSSWASVTAGANSAAKAIGGAGAAQDDMNKKLAGFDEITKLSAQNSGGGGGGSSEAVTSVIEGKTPAWLTSLSEQIQQAAAQGDFFGIGKALSASLTNGLKSIDWVSTFKSIGAAAGNVGSVIMGFFSDSLAAAKDHFADAISRTGGDIFAGILVGIGEGIAGIGSWINDNVLQPLVSGFKSTFRIHSPSKHEEILSIGKNVMLGLLNGLLEPLRDPVGWIKKHIFTPLTDGFKKVFGEDGLFSSLSGGSNGEASINVKAKLTSWKDELRSKQVDFKAKMTTWNEALKNKVVNFQTKLTGWSDSLKNKVVNFKTKLTDWSDSLKDKVVNFQTNLTSWRDALKGKSVNFGTNLTTWSDSLKDKWLTFAADVIKGWNGSLENYLGIGTVTTKLNVKVPEIKVKWKTSYKEPGNPNSSYIDQPIYSVAWNAKGAILSGAQLFGRIGKTFLGGGEAGREALLPLDRNTWWMDKIADRVALKVTGGAQNNDQNITVNLVLDGKIVASTVVRHVNAQAKATGRNPLASYI